MNVREKLVELFYDNNVRCDQKIEGFADDVMDIISYGVTVQEWISVEDRLPEENEYVMIWSGECQIARIEKGISEEQRNAMKRGELDDPYETGWTLSSGYFTLKRSQSYKACDEQGNNRVPY